MHSLPNIKLISFYFTKTNFPNPFQPRSYSHIQESETLIETEVMNIKISSMTNPDSFHRGQLSTYLSGKITSVWLPENEGKLGLKTNSMYFFLLEFLRNQTEGIGK